MSALDPGQARMAHPDPGVEDAIVQASQVPHLENAGWRYLEGDREDWPAELQRFAGQGQVYIRNRETGGTAFVPELTGHLRERGWEEVNPEAEQTAELEAKKVAELRDLAKERGISPIPSTKAELIEALEQPEDVNDQDQAGGEPAPDSKE